MIKKWVSIASGAIITFVLGNLFPVTNLYSKYFVQSHDDENTLVGIILLVEWPLLLAIGGAAGFLIYKKCLK